MTISSEVRKAGPYQGTGANVQFPFAFKITDSSYVVVTVTTPFGIDAILTRGPQYNVTLNADQDANPGGHITLTGAALSLGYKLTITSNVPYLQPTDITNQGGFYPQVIEDALDRLTILIQQLKDKMGRTIQGSVATLSNVDFTLPAPGAGMLIGWNALGTGLTLYDASLAGAGSGGGGGGAGAVSTTGTGTAVRFSLGGIPVNDPKDLLLTVNGLVQLPTTDYTIDVSTQEVVFAVAPANGAKIGMRLMGGSSGAGGGSLLCYIGTTPPTTPSDGLLWWSSLDGNLRIAYGGQWVAAGPVAVGRGTAVPQSIFLLPQQAVTSLTPTWVDLGTIEIAASGLYPIVVTAIFSLVGVTSVVSSSIPGRTVVTYDGLNWMYNAGEVEAVLRLNLSGSTPPAQMASITVEPSRSQSGAFAYTYENLAPGTYTITLQAQIGSRTYSDEGFGIRSISVVAEETK